MTARPKSPAASQFPPDLTEIAAQVAEEENLMPTSEEILRRGFDWRTITGAYGGDNLQQDFETIRKFDHKRMDAVAVALKVRDGLILVFWPSHTVLRIISLRY